MLLCWDYIQENLPLSITACAGCYTLWIWRKVRLCNYRRTSGLICCWSCLVRSWSLQNGGSLGAKKILRRSGIARTSKESSDASQRSKVETYMSLSWMRSDFDYYRRPCSFACCNLWKESRKSRIGRRLFNALSLSGCSWEEDDLNHKYGSFAFTWRSCSWLTASVSISWIP